MTVVGKKTYAPTSGHTNKSFSIEHWFSDIAQSEVFSGCQPSKIDLSLPPTGLATISIPMVGKDLTTATAQYFTSPTASTTTGLTAAVNGVVLLNGTAVAVLTGLTLSIESNRSGDAVVGSNTIPTRFPGRILVSGQATAYFEDATLRDAFVNETEIEIIVALTSDNTATANFVAFVLPRCKVGGSSKSDGEGGIVQTIPFQALLPTTGGAGVLRERITAAQQAAKPPAERAAESIKPAVRDYAAEAAARQRGGVSVARHPTRGAGQPHADFKNAEHVQRHREKETRGGRHAHTLRLGLLHGAGPALRILHERLPRAPEGHFGPDPRPGRRGGRGRSARRPAPCRAAWSTAGGGSCRSPCPRRCRPPAACGRRGPRSASPRTA